MSDGIDTAREQILTGGAPVRARGMLAQVHSRKKTFPRRPANLELPENFRPFP